MKRFLSMDILRGVALMLMVVFHIFMNISELTIKAGDITSIGIFELILIAFIAIFIHWQGFFMMISAIVHWYSMSKMLEKGISTARILGKQMLFGGALYIFGFLREPLLSPWGILADWFTKGGFSYTGPFPWAPAWGMIYRVETLSNIGISIMLTSLIFVALASINKTKITEIGKMIIKISVLAIIALVFIFAAPLIQSWVNAVSGGLNLQVVESYEQLNLANGYADRWLLNTLGGREFPLFPNYSYFLAGAIVGVCLSQEHPTKKLLLGFLIVGIVLTLGGAAYWLFVDRFLQTLNLTFHVHPTGFVIFNIGLELLVLTLFLRMNEFNPRLLNEKRMKRRLFTTRIFRRWGLVALTIFTFNVIELLVRGVLDRLIPSIEYRWWFSTTLPWTLLGVVVLLLLWEGIIRLWELLKFKGTMEWIFLRLFKLGKPYNKADPLDIKGSLYDVTPILFVTPPIKEEIKSNT